MLRTNIVNILDTINNENNCEKYINMTKKNETSCVMDNNNKLTYHEVISRPGYINKVHMDTAEESIISKIFALIEPRLDSLKFILSEGMLLRENAEVAQQEVKPGEPHLEFAFQYDTPNDALPVGPKTLSLVPTLHSGGGIRETGDLLLKPSMWERLLDRGLSGEEADKVMHGNLQTTYSPEPSHSDVHGTAAASASDFATF